MKWNLVVTNVVLTLFALFTGLVFFLVKVYYWDFIDALVYPTTSFDDLVPGVNQFSSFQIIKYFTESFLIVIKHADIDFLIVYVGHNLFIPIAIIFGMITCCSLLFFYISQYNYFTLLPGIICLLFFVLANIIDSPVTKWEVDDAFQKFKYEDVTGLDYIKLLQDEKYDILDEALHGLEIKYLSSDITEQQYEYEFNKFGNINERDFIYLEHWILISNYPEIPLSIRGQAYESLGWDARGTKFAKDTSKEQFEKMNNYFFKAISDHNTSLKKNSKMLFSYLSLFDISRASVDINSEEIYTAANAEIQTSYLLDYTYMNVLQPKWGGSFYEIRSFAKSQRKYAYVEAKLIALGGYEAVYRADDYWNDKDYDNAIKWYKRALLYAPRASLFKQISELYKLKKDYEKAIDILNDGLEYHPNNWLLLVYRAMNNVRVNNLSGAAKDAEAASEQTINKYWLLSNLGWVFENVGDNKKAVELYKRSIDLKSDYIYSFKRLYYLSYIKAISYSDVLPYMKQWVSYEPNSSEAWISYADTMEDIDSQKAVSAYKKYLLLVDRNNTKNLDRVKKVETLLQRMKASNVE